MIALINLSFGIIILANLSSEPLISVVLMAPIWGPIMVSNIQSYITGDNNILL
jgi:hypothetical protein